MTFDTYQTDGFYDEMFGADGRLRVGANLVVERINDLSLEDLQRRQRAAERALLDLGITFNVYGDEASTEKIFPFDIVPRIITQSEWDRIERGLLQRTEALNCFLSDVYGPQKILKQGVVPEDLVKTADGYRPECQGLKPAQGVWCHISGTDLVRDADGALRVLEDNLRCPSGVSYVVENRVVMKRTFPHLFEACRVQPVSDYPSKLLETLQGLMPHSGHPPIVAVWTPGIYNSAYFEHSFLAQQMGVPLVEGRDLAVVNDHLCMRTITGFKPIDILYRRIDDDFIDPQAFRADSVLGVPGLMDLYRRGRVVLANAPGTGVADDKAVYAYLPEIIRYYLDEEILLPNVTTYACWREQDRQYVLENIDQLVVKAVSASGGYDLMIGPHATDKERAKFARRIQGSPRNYIAQPTLALSRMPVMQADGAMEGRHIDLRPFTLCGKETYVLPGGLTRVALKKGSLVVNSSQGGGSKDTWVIDDRCPLTLPPIPEEAPHA